MSNISIIVPALASLTAACATPTAATDAPPDATARHRELLDRRVGFTNRAEWADWEALHDPACVRRAPDLPAPLASSAALRAAIETLGHAFPDYHLTVRDSFGDASWLAARIHTTGTMTGPLRLPSGAEIPPTGRAIEQDWTLVLRFDGDRIVEVDEQYDQYTLLLQLGLLPPP